MRINPNERVGRGLDLLRDSLKPFIKHQMESVYGNRAQEEMVKSLRDRSSLSPDSKLFFDINALLKIIDWHWNDVFVKAIHSDRQRAVRSLIKELQDTRLQWAHSESYFSTDDAYRALDSIERLLKAISANDEAQKIKISKQELLYSLEETTVQSKPNPMPTSGQTEVIMDTSGMSADQVVGRKVLCPACSRKVFDQWPFGWDSHAASRCSGITGRDDEERKERYKSQFRHLFRR